MLILN